MDRKKTLGRLERALIAGLINRRVFIVGPGRSRLGWTRCARLRPADHQFMITQPRAEERQ
jgi:hypothetical protein